MIDQNFYPTINSIWTAQSHLLEYIQSFLANYLEKKEHGFQIKNQAA